MKKETKTFPPVTNLQDSLVRIDAIDTHYLTSYVKKSQSAEAEFGKYVSEFAGIPKEYLPEKFDTGHPACQRHHEGYIAGLPASTRKIMELEPKQRSKKDYPDRYREYDTTMQATRRAWVKLMDALFPPVADTGTDTDTGNARLKGNKAEYSREEKLAAGIEYLKKLFSPEGKDQTTMEVKVCMCLGKALDTIVADVGTEKLKKAISQVSANKLKSTVSCSRPKGK